MKLTTMLSVAFILVCAPFIFNQMWKQRDLNRTKVEVGDLVTITPSVDEIMHETEISKACESATVMALAEIEDKHVAWIIARNCEFPALGKKFTYINLITTTDTLERIFKHE